MSPAMTANDEVERPHDTAGRAPVERSFSVVRATRPHRRRGRARRLSVRQAPAAHGAFSESLDADRTWESSSEHEDHHEVAIHSGD